MARTIGKIPNIRAQNGLILLAEWTPSAATLDETLTLDGDAVKFIEYEANLLATSANAAVLHARFNNDSGGNYNTRNMNITASGTGAFQELTTLTEMNLCVASASARGAGRGSMFVARPGARGLLGDYGLRGDEIHYHWDMRWTNTADNITSIVFTLTQVATGFIRIWRRI